MENDQYNFQQTIENIKEKYELDLVALAFLQPAQFEYILTWQFAVGNINERIKRLVLQSGKGVAGIVYKSGKPMIVKSAEKELPKDNLYNYPVIISEKLKSFCALPLFRYNKVVGVILLAFRSEKMTDELFNLIKTNMKEDFPYFYQNEMVNN